jgi:hypothetical protein
VNIGRQILGFWMKNRILGVRFFCQAAQRFYSSAATISGKANAEFSWIVITSKVRWRIVDRS